MADKEKNDQKKLNAMLVNVYTTALKIVHVDLKKFKFALVLQKLMRELHKEIKRLVLRFIMQEILTSLKLQEEINPLKKSIYN